MFFLLKCIILSTQKLLHCKGYYKQNEKTTEGEKIFANNVTDKELVSKIYKQLTQHIARGEETLGPELGGDGGLATGESEAAERLRGPFCSWMACRLWGERWLLGGSVADQQQAGGSSEAGVPSASGHPSTSASASPRPPSQSLQWGLALTLGCKLTDTRWPVKADTLTEDQQWDNRAPGTSPSYVKGMSLLVRAWQNMVHWRRECTPCQYSCLESPLNSMKRQKDMTWKMSSPRLVGVQYTTGEKQRNSYRKNEEAEWSEAEMRPSCGCI